jgi:hypothetical protein
MTQVVRHLLSKRETLRSNPVLPKITVIIINKANLGFQLEEVLEN